MNIMWNVLNLIPVIPMDGGRWCVRPCAATFHPAGCALPWGCPSSWPGPLRFIPSWLAAIPICGIPAFLTGPRLSHWESSLPTFNMIFFAILAVQNFMMMQAVKRQEQSWDNDDGYQDPDRDRYQRRDRDRDCRTPRVRSTSPWGLGGNVHCHVNQEVKSFWKGWHHAGNIRGRHHQRRRHAH